MPVLRSWLARIAGLGLLLTGCRDAGSQQTPLAVFAASSLTEAFEALEGSFERQRPELDVRLTFAGSQVLRLQIERGAAADVFAAASEEHMDALVEGGRAGSPKTFARNALVVIVPSANPAGIERLEDLVRASKIVIGAETVPVGAYTRQMLERLEASQPGLARQVRASVVSEESNARLVRAKVELGEADAAVVYRTDAAASDRVRIVELPEGLAVTARYPIAAIEGAPRVEPAASFIAHVLSEDGQRTLVEHGFSPP